MLRDSVGLKLHICNLIVVPDKEEHNQLPPFPSERICNKAMRRQANPIQGRSKS